MTDLFLSKLPVHPDGRSPYAIFLVHEEDGGILDALPSDPIDDAAALAQARAKWASARLSCALDLAVVGAPLGYTPRETPTGAGRCRAGAAVRIVEGLRVEVASEVRIELLDACAAFLRSAVWKEKGASPTKRYAVRGSLTEAGSDRTVNLVLRITETAEGPGIELCDNGSFEAMLHERAEPMRPLRLCVTMTSSPAFVAEVVDDAFGVSFVPRVAMLLEGSLGPHGDLEALLLAATLRAVASGRAPRQKGEAHFDDFVVRVDVDRAKTLAFVPPARGSRLERREMARATVQALCAADPNVDLGETFCLLLDVRSGVSKTISEAMDQLRGVATSKSERAAAARSFAKEPEWRATLVPRAGAEALADYIGPQNMALLREPVPAYGARVLIIEGNRSEVVDVDVELAEAGRLRSELDELHEAEALLPEILDEEKKRKAAPAPALPPFEGTWRDGRRYLPSTLAPGWTVRDVDARGVVTVDAGEGLSFQVGVARRDGKREVSVLIMRADANKPVREEVDRILPLIRGCKAFAEMGVYRGEQKMPMPGMRAFAARMTGDGVS